MPSRSKRTELVAPRLRFAPSPTGPFHVGSARSALFNWLFARRHGGVLLLRIEDTDDERNSEEWVSGITDALDWLGLAPDEPPVRQSQFAAQHHAAADALLASGALYGCDCTRDQIDERLRGTGRTGYDGHCRDRGLGRGPGVALRFAVPRDGVTVVRDLIRGDVVYQNTSIEDFVVERSNGSVLFALSNLVDDRTMSITHVVRGEEHVANTPKQLLLAHALNEAEGTKVPDPFFAHLPLLVNEKRQKLSKRRDPVAVELYRSEGYLADAMVNFLALLGWSPAGDTEIESRDALVEQFALEDVNHSPAFFDVAKLRHLNGVYLRSLSPAGFVDACRPWVAPTPGAWAPPQRPPWPEASFDETTFERIAPLVQERVTTLGEVPDMVDFLFLDEPPIDEAAFDKSVRKAPQSREILESALASFAEVPFEAETLHEALAGIGERLGLPLRRTQAPVRIAITGRQVGPPLFESMAILGREEVRRRLQRSLALLG